MVWEYFSLCFLLCFVFLPSVLVTTGICCWPTYPFKSKHALFSSRLRYCFSCFLELPLTNMQLKGLWFSWEKVVAHFWRIFVVNLYFKFHCSKKHQDTQYSLRNTEGPILHPAQFTFYTDACIVASLFTRCKADFPPQQTGATTLVPGEACQRKAEACPSSNDTWCYFSDLKNVPIQLRYWPKNPWSKCTSG